MKIPFPSEALHFAVNAIGQIDQSVNWSIFIADEDQLFVLGTKDESIWKQRLAPESSPPVKQIDYPSKCSRMNSTTAMIWRKDDNPAELYIYEVSENRLRRINVTPEKIFIAFEVIDDRIIAIEIKPEYESVLKTYAFYDILNKENLFEISIPLELNEQIGTRIPKTSLIEIDNIFYICFDNSFLIFQFDPKNGKTNNLIEDKEKSIFREKLKLKIKKLLKYNNALILISLVEDISIMKYNTLSKEFEAQIIIDGKFEKIVDATINKDIVYLLTLNNGEKSILRVPIER
ncbi:MAG: hypothetical protein K9J12_16410 [Melioribacteraceae bacterium]|nr:hypothetical protein [Melioribacteraceae bacterium]MCF8264920.1 hypothetical protein [Melioribacteraceae bacterium]MCF8430721.1 hypothetical protein [Melioribacteraceae bacterium]